MFGLVWIEGIWWEVVRLAEGFWVYSLLRDKVVRSVIM